MATVDPKRPVRMLADLIAILLVVGMGTLLIFYFLYQAGSINSASKQVWYIQYFQLLVIVVVAIIVISLVGRILKKVLVPRASASVGASLMFAFDALAYVVLLVLVFTKLGIDVTGFLVGAGFLGIVLGLAAQQVLGNFLGALAIMVARPFHTGDRITMVASNYGVVWPSYPHETLPAGYTGTVAEISLMYTRLHGDDGRPFTVPNGVLSQALVINHTRALVRDVRVRIVVPRRVEFAEYVAKAMAALADVGGLRRDTVVARITSVDAQTYEVLFQGTAVGGADEQIRSEMLRKLLPVTPGLS